LISDDNQTWPCCSWDADFKETDVCKKTPKNRFGDYFGSNQVLNQMEGHACWCKDWLKNEYEWVPENCAFPKWNSDLFCELLGERRILFVGDSTQQQSAVSLMNQIFWYSSPGKSCADRIVFAMGDTLVGRKFGGRNKGRIWTDAVDQYNPDIVILAVGPHVKQVNDYIAILREVINVRKEKYKEKLFFWRTQFPAGCSSHILESFPEEHFWDNYRGSQYNYRRFADWDDIARKEWSTVENSYILDLKPMYYRADVHVSSRDPDTVRKRDCLHFCGGGKSILSTYLTRVILNLLMLLNEK
jgi:hypothetical protein